MSKRVLNGWALPCVLLCSSLLLSACGGEDVAPDDVVRKTSGSANLQGLWRMSESFVGGEVFYSTLLIQGTGNAATMTDCSRAFEADELTRTGNQVSGYQYDLAPLQVLNNDTLRWQFDNQTRHFEKMDTQAQFNMGEFSVRSPLLPDVVASNWVCVQFSETDHGDVLVLTTHVLGQPLLVTISAEGRLQPGTYQIEPYGNEDAMVILSGRHWANTTLTAYDEVSAGTLTIRSRGEVWLEGELEGVLRNGITPIQISFNVETPLN